MIQRLAMLVAIIVLAGFIGVLVVEVPRLDLGIVCLVVFAFVVYDYIRTFHLRRD